MNFPFDKDIVLENNMVVLAPISPQDVENLLAVATKDKDLLQFSPFPVYSKELLTQYIDRAITNRSSGSRYAFTVFDKNRNAYAGSTSFLNISNVDDRLEIGST